MRKVLAVVLAVAVLGFTAYTADAQVANVQVYFDANFTQTQAICGGVGIPQDLFVVANNFGMFMSAIEYKVVLPPSLFYIAEVTTAPVIVGNALAGVAMSWAVPQDAFGALGVSRIIATWQCNDCAFDLVADEPIVVVPHPISGLVRAVRWPDNTLFNAFGLTSIVCADVVPTEETNWGKVKALYGN